MATRSFINDIESEEAKKLLLHEGARALSEFLGQVLEKKLSSHPFWQQAKPLRLGSWSRGELCSKSDIDLLFVGSEEDVGALVKDFQKEGIKIRYRVPADKSDWTENVESFDVLALMGANAFFEEDTAALAEQQKQIAKLGKTYFRKLFKTMLSERKERAERYDSISNYLEPNLKYGPGGLRDLEQALMIRMLFKEKFERDDEVFTKLTTAKEYMLKIRHFLHLHGAGDVFTGALQRDAAAFFGESSPQKFMSELELILSEVSFYADWIAEVATKSDAAIKQVESVKIDSLDAAFSALKKDPSVLMQQHVRKNFRPPKNRKLIGSVLEKYFRSDMSDDYLQSIFRSHLMANLIPELQRLRGHVQHDQYHRYSVDAHTLQAVREVLRVKRQPKKLGRLSAVVKELKSFEWEVLLWSALYHDLGKGLEGSHSIEGAELAKKDMVGMGVSLKLTAQVTWMVQSHLLLSGAAFRKNPHDAATWAELFRRGVKGRRIHKLTIFTAIDIRATNPEAWNDWKERLLFDLCEILQSPKASRLSEFLDFAESKGVKVDKEFIEKLDPELVSRLPREKLLSDYRELMKAGGDLPPLVLVNNKKETWIRFHSKTDKKGLFLSFVNQLHNAGLSVQEAFVQTYPQYGAYDWFKVKSAKPAALVKKMLVRPTQSQLAYALVFDVIEIVAQDEKSAIVSFRGKDQRGALLSAARAIFESGFEIQSAKVHTWGRQIDDVFTVLKSQNFDLDFANLVEKNS